MFIRFVLQRKHPDTGMEEGVFQAAYELRRAGDIPKDDLKKLDTLLEWFRTNLDTPERFSRTTSKGYRRRATKGVSWLKPGAKEHIAKFWALKEILDKHGHFVSLIKVQRPGYIVYEDKHQVVAEPFADIRD